MLLLSPSYFGETPRYFGERMNAFGSRNGDEVKDEMILSSEGSFVDLCTFGHHFCYCVICLGVKPFDSKLECLSMFL
jgi:hypothetical protein